jgi:hypothetical protein
MNVAVTEHELAEPDLAPPEEAPHDALATGVALRALNGGLGKAVRKAEVLARVPQPVGELLVHEAQPAALDLPFPAGHSLISRRFRRRVHGDEDVRLPCAEPVVPELGGALSHVAQLLRSRGHADSELGRKSREGGQVELQRLQATRRERDVERPGQVFVPLLLGGDRVDQAAQQPPAGIGLLDVGEQVARVAEAVAAQDVPLQVVAVERHRGNRSRKACASPIGPSTAASTTRAESRA